MAYATSLAGSKLRAKLGATLNENASAPTSDFAQNQLLKMGWSNGDGLGKNRQGISSHITVNKREDSVGLGHSDVPQTTHQWWKDSVSDTLAKLSSKTTKKKKRKAKDYTDEELFEATGGARFGMRAQRRATAKWKRTESQTEEDERLAKEKMEWNGLGDAQVKLEAERPRKKRKKDIQECGSEAAANEASKGKTKAKKKKRKKDKKSSKKDKKSKRSKSDES